MGWAKTHLGLVSRPPSRSISFHRHPNSLKELRILGGGGRHNNGERTNYDRALLEHMPRIQSNGARQTEACLSQSFLMMAHDQSNMIMNYRGTGAAKLLAVATATPREIGIGAAVAQTLRLACNVCRNPEETNERTIHDSWLNERSHGSLLIAHILMKQHEIMTACPR